MTKKEKPSDSSDFDESEDEKDSLAVDEIFGEFYHVFNTEMPLEEVDDEFEDPSEETIFKKVGYTTKPFFAFGNLINIWVSDPRQNGNLVYRIQLNLTWKPFSCPRGARMVHYFGGYIFVLVNRQILPPLIFGRRLTSDEIEGLKSGNIFGNEQSSDKTNEIDRDIQFIEEIINIADDVDDEAILLPGRSTEPNLREEPESSAASEEREKRNRELENGASAEKDSGLDEGASSTLPEAITETLSGTDDAADSGPEERFDAPAAAAAPISLEIEEDLLKDVEPDPDFVEQEAANLLEDEVVVEAESEALEAENAEPVGNEADLQTAVGNEEDQSNESEVVDLVQEDEIANDELAEVDLNPDMEEILLRPDPELDNSNEFDEKEAEKYLDEEPGNIEFENGTGEDIGREAIQREEKNQQEENGLENPEEIDLETDAVQHKEDSNPGSILNSEELEAVVENLDVLRDLWEVDNRYDEVDAASETSEFLEDDKTGVAEIEPETDDALEPSTLDLNPDESSIITLESINNREQLSSGIEPVKPKNGEERSGSDALLKLSDMDNHSDELKVITQGIVEQASSKIEPVKPTNGEERTDSDSLLVTSLVDLRSDGLSVIIPENIQCSYSDALNFITPENKDEQEHLLNETKPVKPDNGEERNGSELATGAEIVVHTPPIESLLQVESTVFAISNIDVMGKTYSKTPTVDEPNRPKAVGGRKRRHSASSSFQYWSQIGEQLIDVKKMKPQADEEKTDDSKNVPITNGNDELQKLANEYASESENDADEASESKEVPAIQEEHQQQPPSDNVLQTIIEKSDEPQEQVETAATSEKYDIPDIDVPPVEIDILQLAEIEMTEAAEKVTDGLVELIDEGVTIGTVKLQIDSAEIGEEVSKVVRKLEPALEPSETRNINNEAEPIESPPVRVEAVVLKESRVESRSTIQSVARRPCQFSLDEWNVAREKVNRKKRQHRKDQGIFPAHQIAAYTEIDKVVLGLPGDESPLLDSTKVAQLRMEEIRMEDESAGNLAYILEECGLGEDLQPKKKRRVEAKTVEAETTRIEKTVKAIIPRPSTPDRQVDEILEVLETGFMEVDEAEVYLNQEDIGFEAEENQETNLGAVEKVMGFLIKPVGEDSKNQLESLGIEEIVTDLMRDLVDTVESVENIVEKVDTIFPNGGNVQETGKDEVDLSEGSDGVSRTLEIPTEEDMDAQNKEGTSIYGFETFESSADQQIVQGLLQDLVMAVEVKEQPVEKEEMDSVEQAQVHVEIDRTSETTESANKFEALQAEGKSLETTDLAPEGSHESTKEHPRNEMLIDEKLGANNTFEVDQSALGLMQDLVVAVEVREHSDEREEMNPTVQAQNHAEFEQISGTIESANKFEEGHAEESSSETTGQASESLNEPAEKALKNEMLIGEELGAENTFEVDQSVPGLMQDLVVAVEVREHSDEREEMNPIVQAQNHAEFEQISETIESANKFEEGHAEENSSETTGLASDGLNESAEEAPRNEMLIGEELGAENTFEVHQSVLGLMQDLLTAVEIGEHSDETKNMNSTMQAQNYVELDPISETIENANRVEAGQSEGNPSKTTGIASEDLDETTGEAPRNEMQVDEKTVANNTSETHQNVIDLMQDLLMAVEVGEHRDEREEMNPIVRAQNHAEFEQISGTFEVVNQFEEGQAEGNSSGTTDLASEGSDEPDEESPRNEMLVVEESEATNTSEIHQSVMDLDLVMAVDVGEHPDGREKMNPIVQAQSHMEFYQISEKIELVDDSMEIFEDTGKSVKDVEIESTSYSENRDDGISGKDHTVSEGFEIESDALEDLVVEGQDMMEAHIDAATSECAEFRETGSQSIDYPMEYGIDRKHGMGSESFEIDFEDLEDPEPSENFEDPECPSSSLKRKAARNSSQEPPEKKARWENVYENSMDYCDPTMGETYLSSSFMLHEWEEPKEEKEDDEIDVVAFSPEPEPFKEDKESGVVAFSPEPEPFKENEESGVVAFSPEPEPFKENEESGVVAFSPEPEPFKENEESGVVAFSPEPEPFKEDEKSGVVAFSPEPESFKEDEESGVVAFSPEPEPFEEDEESDVVDLIPDAEPPKQDESYVDEESDLLQGPVSHRFLWAPVREEPLHPEYGRLPVAVSFINLPEEEREIVEGCSDDLDKEDPENCEEEFDEREMSGKDSESENEKEEKEEAVSEDSEPEEGGKLKVPDYGEDKEKREKRLVEDLEDQEDYGEEEFVEADNEPGPSGEQGAWKDDSFESAPTLLSALSVSPTPNFTPPVSPLVLSPPQDLERSPSLSPAPVPPQAQRASAPVPPASRAQQRRVDQLLNDLQQVGPLPLKRERKPVRYSK